MRRRTFIGGVGAALAMGSAGRARPSDDSAIPLSGFTTLISGLEHAEGIAVAPDGQVYVTDGTRGVLAVGSGGMLRPVGPVPAPAGIAIAEDGALVVANVGLLKGVAGPLLRINPKTGTASVLADRVNGRELVASNFPAIARDGSIYCTHSTWSDIRNIGRREASGFVYRVRPDGRVDLVAEGLRSPNGCCFDRDQRFLYVALTAEGRICRFRRRPDGSLGPHEDYGPALGAVVPDHGIDAIRAMPAADRSELGYCDGIAFDEAGDLWVTLPFANALVKITAAGRLVRVAEDPQARVISMPTNIAWAGEDRRDLLVVCRGSGTVVRARTAVPGLTLAP